MNWIDVKNDLPKADGKFLLLIQRHYHVTGVFYKGFFYKKKSLASIINDQYRDEKKYSDVTHWMSLPELPALKPV